MPNLTDRALRWLRAPINPRRVRRLDAGPAKGSPYLDGEDVIDTLNEIFGFGEWSFELTSPPWMAESGVEGQNKTPYEVWCAMGRLTVGGVSHMGLGTNTRSGLGSSSLEMAMKGAVTDALKRSAVHHGDQFGLGLRHKPNDRDMTEAWNKWVADERARRSGNDQTAQDAQPETAPTENTRRDEPLQTRHAPFSLADVAAAFRDAKFSESLAGGFIAGSTAPARLTDDHLATFFESSPHATLKDLVSLSIEWFANNAANPQMRENCAHWLGLESAA